MSPLKNRVPGATGGVPITPDAGSSPSGPTGPIGPSAYQAAVLADGPAAYWPLNETAGTVAQDFGATPADNGTYTGTPITGYRLGAHGMDGFGTSVQFFGSNSYVDMGGPLASKLQFAGNFTIEAWVAFTLAPGSVTPGASVVCEPFSGDGNVRYMLGFHNGSSNGKTATWGWYNGSWRLITASTTDLSNGDWHHLVGTYDAGANVLELWVDAVSQGTLTPGGTAPTGTEGFYVGRRWDGGGDQYFNGWIDEVAAYPTKLSSGRISAHYGARVSTPAGARVTQELVDAPINVTNPRGRVSQVHVQAVIERDYAGWDTLVVEDHLDFE